MKPFLFDIVILLVIMGFQAFLITASVLIGYYLGRKTVILPDTKPQDTPRPDKSKQINPMADDPYEMALRTPAEQMKWEKTIE